MNRVCVRDLAARFLWEIITGDSEALNRPIMQIDTNRPGLELAGYFPETETEDGCKYELHTEEQDQMLARLIRGIQSGEIEIKVSK